MPESKSVQWFWVARWFLVGCATAAAILWGLPILLTLHPHLSGFEKHKAINEARTGVAAVLAALGGGAGLGYTARTYRLSGQGQIADRYTRAVEQLGNEGVSVRIGGIHGLARTVRDAEGYGQVVVSVLAAFVRDDASIARFRWTSRWHSSLGVPD